MQLIYKDLDADIAARIYALFDKQDCFIEVQPGNVVLPRKYAEIGTTIREMPTHPDDVWLISYPRSGSTWAQEMVWLLGNNLDYERAKQMQQLRAPLIELPALFSLDHVEWVANTIGNTLDAVRNMPRPRFARSHLPWQLLPEDFEIVQPKIIYTARNPKDLCVSYYHYCKLMHDMHGTFEDFQQLFLEGHTPIGSFWTHVLPFWKRSTDPNVLFLKYEDMKRDLPRIVRKTARFLNVAHHLTNSKLERICEHLKFDKMQRNPAVNLEPLLNTEENGNIIEQVQHDSKFIRKGQIGDWKNYMSTDMSNRFDEWIDENTRGSGLVFDYE